MMKRALPCAIVAIALVLIQSSITPANAAADFQQDKTKLLKRVRSSTPVTVQIDDTQGSPLHIDSATAREISGIEYGALVGGVAANSAQSSFPDTTLTNSSGKVIRSFALLVRSSIDRR